MKSCYQSIHYDWTFSLFLSVVVWGVVFIDTFYGWLGLIVINIQHICFKEILRKVRSVSTSTSAAINYHWTPATPSNMDSPSWVPTSTRTTNHKDPSISASTSTSIAPMLLSSSNLSSPISNIVSWDLYPKVTFWQMEDCFGSLAAATSKKSLTESYNCWWRATVFWRKVVRKRCWRISKNFMS